MGVYENHILPRMLHFAMKNSEVTRERSRALESVEGDVLELGFGSGLNLRHYGKKVRRVVGVDPSATAGRMAARAIASVEFPVEIRNEPAESIAAAAEFDAVVSTFTLCTIPDVEAAISAAKRALKPSGRFFFLEHGLSHEANIEKWQRRMEPLQKIVCGGCHLTRDARALLESAGFTVEQADKFYMKGPKPWAFVTRGIARAT